MEQKIVAPLMCLAFVSNSSVLKFEVAQKLDTLCKRSGSRHGVFNDSHSMFDVSVSGEPNVTVSIPQFQEI